MNPKEDMAQRVLETAQSCAHHHIISSSPHGSFGSFHYGWEPGGFCWCAFCGAIRIGGTTTWVRPGAQGDVYADIRRMTAEVVSEIPVGHPARNCSVKTFSIVKDSKP